MEILVVSESPKDVFSEHLLGKGMPVTRLGYSSAMTELKASAGKFETILVVNQKIEAAVKIKREAPSSRVISINGGAKQFTPLLTVVYGENDNDPFSYHDWDDFSRLIFSCDPRPVKLLKFEKTGNHSNRYKINLEAVRSSEDQPNYNLSRFIDGMVFLSRHSLAWQQEWLGEIIEKTFEVSFKFNRDKKIRNIIIPVLNEYKGLPIFKEGDEVDFYEDYNSDASFTATVLQIGDGEMLVQFPKRINRKSLEKISSFRPQPQFLGKKIANLQEELRIFEVLGSDFSSGSPAAYLTHTQALVNSREPNNGHSSPVFFSKDTERILRDPSQVEAFVSCLGPAFFNFIIGPAGTGKTFVTAALAQQFVQRKKTILLLSHSNLGVDNLVLEVAKHVSNKKLFRFGNDAAVISPPARAFHCSERQNGNFFGFPKDSARVAEKRFLKEVVEKNEGVVLASTLDSYRSILNLKELKIKPDIVIVDEASRGSFYEFLAPIIDAREKVIFIGDNRQLGNIAPSQELTAFLSEKAEAIPAYHSFRSLELKQSIVEYFNKGFFNSLIELGYFQPSLLNCNRRSLVLISDLISRVFYGDGLVPGRFDPYNNGRIIFLDTKDAPKFVEERKGTSYYNPVESAYLVKQFVPLAVKHILAGGKIADLVIISPYMAQVRWLKKKLRNHLLFHPVIKGQVNPENIDAILEQMVITVDAIQGGQRKMVFVSLVCSNDQQRIGFNHDVRRLNVALSRAQETLVIVGNSRPFLDCQYGDINQAFQAIIRYAKAKGIYRKVKQA